MTGEISKKRGPVTALNLPAAFAVTEPQAQEEGDWDRGGVSRKQTTTRRRTGPGSPDSCTMLDTGAVRRIREAVQGAGVAEGRAGRAVAISGDRT